MDGHAPAVPTGGAGVNEFAAQQTRLRSWAQGCACVVLVTALVVLIGGWVLEIDSLRNFVPGTVEVKPSTALALIFTAFSIMALSAISPAAWQTRVGRFLAVLVLLIGLAFLFEFLLGWNPGIDEFPFRDVSGRAEGVEFPGRLAPATAVNLVLTGLALLTVDVHLKGRWRLGEVIALPIFVIAAMTSVAYMYSISSFYEPDPSTKMALSTSVCFVLIAFSIVFMRPQGRLSTILSTDAPGGVIARHLAPILIVLPLLLGWARLEAADAGIFDNRMGTWWLTMAVIAISLLVLGRVASKLNEVDEERREMERKLYDQANLDGLTGLWNRRRFRQELAGHASRSRRHGGSTAIIAIALDGLLEFDERYGHAAGSSMVEKVGRTILETIRVSDIAGRLTGDEFAVLLPESSSEGARTVAEKLRREIAAVGAGQENELGQINITASLGVSQLTGPLTDDGHALLALANKGMIDAGRKGGNRTVVDSSGEGETGPRVNKRVVAEALNSSPPMSATASKANIDRGSIGIRVLRHPWLPAVASVVAVLSLSVLVWDHFQSLGEAPAVIASPLLVAALACALYLFRSAALSRRDFERFEWLRFETAEASSDSLVTIDSDGTILEWNPVSAQIFGCARNEAIGRNLGEFIGPTGWDEWRRRGAAALTGGGAKPVLDQLMELTAISERGRTFPIEMTLSPIQGNRPRFVAFIRDISERRSQDEEKERLAAIVRSSQDAIYSKDLRGVVTAWNRGAEELFGFTSTEAIGKRLTNLTVPADRAGEVEEIIERVKEGGSASMVSTRLTKSGKTLEVSLRSFPIRDLRGEIVGVSISAHDITERLLLEKQGVEDAERSLWNQRIRTALDHDDFVFFGQPVIDVRSGNVHHHELLIRMELDGEIVSPDKFLPHAEASDLILDIDRWAIRRGIEYSAISPVAINLSGLSLSIPGLSDFVKDTLAEVNANPADVQFEITETAAAENLDDARRLVGQLADLGCGSSLDDFGTGYGTFTYLKYLPVTELKIDVTFIRDLAKDPDNRVVSSIIAVAQSFDMSTVAEGVEDSETLELLQRMEVDLAQGYHIGRPRPMDSVVEDLVETGKITSIGKPQKSYGGGNHV